MALFLVPGVVVLAAPGEGAVGLRAQDITPLALSAEQGVAVLRYADGSLHTVHQGQLLDKNGLTLKAVLAERIVLGQLVAGQGEQVTWVFRPDREGARPRIERFSSAAPAEPAQQKAVSQLIPLPLSNGSSGPADPAALTAPRR